MVIKCLILCLSLAVAVLGQTDADYVSRDYLLRQLSKTEYGKCVQPTPFFLQTDSGEEDGDSADLSDWEQSGDADSSEVHEDAAESGERKDGEQDEDGEEEDADVLEAEAEARGRFNPNQRSLDRLLDPKITLYRPSDSDTHWYGALRGTPQRSVRKLVRLTVRKRKPAATYAQRMSKFLKKNNVRKVQRTARAAQRKCIATAIRTITGVFRSDPAYQRCIRGVATVRRLVGAPAQIALDVTDYSKDDLVNSLVSHESMAEAAATHAAARFEPAGATPGLANPLPEDLLLSRGSKPWRNPAIPSNRVLVATARKEAAMLRVCFAQARIRAARASRVAPIPNLKSLGNVAAPKDVIAGLMRSIAPFIPAMNRSKYAKGLGKDAVVSFGKLRGRNNIANPRIHIVIFEEPRRDNAGFVRGRKVPKSIRSVVRAAPVRGIKGRRAVTRLMRKARKAVSRRQRSSGRNGRKVRKGRKGRKGRKVRKGRKGRKVRKGRKGRKSAPVPVFNPTWRPTKKGVQTWGYDNGTDKLRRTNSFDPLNPDERAAASFNPPPRKVYAPTKPGKDENPFKPAPARKVNTQHADPYWLE